MAKLPRLAFCLLACSSLVRAASAEASEPAFLSWAERPPLGWNSWDCFGTTLNEENAKAQAAAFVRDLKPHGWQYFVVDIQWYEPGSQGYDYREGSPVTLDGFGRLQPAPNKFPSSAGGAGFRPLAEHIHSLGLKFGIHLMRGIPRRAVKENLPVFGTSYHAQDIANPQSICPWNPDMYGVDMTKPGAQDYYDSVFALFAQWGVDYVKVDDIARPYHDHEKEIEAIRRAIDKTGRPIVLSLSPGETALTAAAHVREHANLWRISDDFWDTWTSLQAQFARLEAWNPHRRPGAWPDADMLPLGRLQLNSRSTRFTPDEQKTLMTLWSIARSPLMHGGDMTHTDAATLALLTNPEVLAVNQASAANRPVSNRDDLIVWTADDPYSKGKYVALFNARGPVSLQPGHAAFRSDVISPALPGHGVDIDLELKGATQLVLVAENAGHDINLDHAVWINPRVALADGSERSLLDAPWDRAEALWDQVSTVKNGSGGKIQHGGVEVARSISVHAKGEIHYTLPPGAVRLLTRAGLEDTATQPGREGAVRMAVYLGGPEGDVKKTGLPVAVSLSELGLSGAVTVRDLWERRDEGVVEGELRREIPWHGAALFKLTPR